MAAMSCRGPFSIRHRCFIPNKGLAFLSRLFCVVLGSRLERVKTIQGASNWRVQYPVAFHVAVTLNCFRFSGTKLTQIE